jgi:hypothetical protein
MVEEFGKVAEDSRRVGKESKGVFPCKSITYEG